MSGSGDLARGDVPASLPMSGQDQEIAEAVKNMTGRPRQSCRGAYAHLEKAWTIADIDPGMSLFRAITAEEEAASALMYAVRDRGYDQADRLNPHSHPHKAAVFPFLAAVAPVAGSGFTHIGASAKLTKETPRFDVIFPIGDDLVGQIDNPFNFFITRDDDGAFVRAEILEKLEAIAADGGFNHIMAYVKRNANERNRILYADAEGYPEVQPDRGFIIEKLRRVKIISAVTIIVTQTEQRQAFVSACVPVFADVVAKAKRVIDAARAP